MSTSSRIGDPVAVLRQLLAAKRVNTLKLAKAAAELFHVPSRTAVPALLPLIRHGVAAVRLGAVRGLAARPVPQALRALCTASNEDASPEIRAAAEKVLDDFDATPIECIMCGDPATLAPEPDPDPNREQLPKPMFCTEACAVRWALLEAPSEYHLCVTVLRWERGGEDECDRCSDAATVGAEAEGD